MRLALPKTTIGSGSTTGYSSSGSGSGSKIPILFSLVLSVNTALVGLLKKPNLAISEFWKKNKFSDFGILKKKQI